MPDVNLAEVLDERLDEILERLDEISERLERIEAVVADVTAAAQALANGGLGGLLGALARGK